MEVDRQVPLDHLEEEDIDEKPNGYNEKSNGEKNPVNVAGAGGLDGLDAGEEVAVKK